MSLLSFSCSKSYYFLIIFWLLNLSVTVIRDLYLEQEIKYPDYMKGIEYIYISCLNLGDLLAGFLVLRTMKKIRRLNPDNTLIEKVMDTNRNKKKALSYELINLLFDFHPHYFLFHYHFYIVH